MEMKDVKTHVRESLYEFVIGAIEASSEDMFIAEYGTSEAFAVWDSDGNEVIDCYPSADEIVRYLRDVYSAVHMSVREMRQMTGLSQAAFADYYCIPRRSVENWEAETQSAHRECPVYVKLFLAQISGIVDIF